jgi:putative holliday junction resolvase
MRVLGVDYGEKRIGLAVSDDGEVIALPLEVVDRGGEIIGDARKIARIAKSEDCGRIVVGMPVTMKGERGPAARQAERFAKTLRNQTPLPVVVWDERLSTAQANRSLLAADVSRAGRRDSVDKIAAALILQNHLDAQRAAQARADDQRQLDDQGSDAPEDTDTDGSHQ